MIFLGVGPAPRLRGGVQFAEIETTTWSVDLAAYPPWMVLLCVSLVVALLIWIFMKALKVTLRLLVYAVLIGGTAYAIWVLFSS